MTYFLITNDGQEDQKVKLSPPPTQLFPSEAGEKSRFVWISHPASSDSTSVFQSMLWNARVP